MIKKFCQKKRLDFVLKIKKFIVASKIQVWIWSYKLQKQIKIFNSYNLKNSYLELVSLQKKVVDKHKSIWTRLKLSFT